MNDEIWICGNCGNPNLIENIYCDNCGIKLKR
jgi:hypothetical protein